MSQHQPLAPSDPQGEDADDAHTAAMIRDWQDQDRRRAELLEQHLRSVLEVARTWQPDYATALDRRVLDLAAAEVGHVAHQVAAAEPTDAQATPIPCSLNVAGTTYPAGTPFCDVIDKVMTELEASRRGLAQPAAQQGEIKAYIQLSHSPEDGENAELIWPWRKDDELEGGLYEYLPLVLARPQPAQVGQGGGQC